MNRVRLAVPDPAGPMKSRSRSSAGTVRGMILLLALALSLAVACGKPEEKDKTYTLTGKIIARDKANNTLTIEHQDVPGLMEGMTMPFPLHGATVDEVPPDGTPIVATLHVSKSSYFVTDVKAQASAAR